jgi:O-antigen/teichoic acid export membrane protein
VSSVFMNAMSVIRFQIVGGVLASFINLALSIWLTRRLGPAGVALGSIISSILLAVPTFWIVIPRVLRSLEQHRMEANTGVVASPI